MRPCQLVGPPLDRQVTPLLIEFFCVVGITLIRSSIKSENTTRPLQRFLKPFHRIMESINQTLKAQLDLEHHDDRKRQRVEFEGRFDRAEGRKTFFTSVARTGDTLIASAEAVCLAPRTEPSEQARTH